MLCRCVGIDGSCFEVVRPNVLLVIWKVYVRGGSGSVRDAYIVLPS